MSKKVCKSWTRSSSETVEICHIWTIENFSLRKDEILYSSEFSSPRDFNTRKWKVKLYPNKENKGYLALYLELIHNKTYGGNIEVSGSFSIHDDNGICLKQMPKTNKTYSRSSLTWGYSKFYKRDGLLSKLTNDVLKITCDLSYLIVSQNVCGTHESSPLTIQEINEETSFKDLSDNFGTLLTDPEFSDVTLCIVGERETTEFKAHWLILAARSPYFATMFRSDFKETRENKVEIKEVKPEIFKEILSYVYTGKIEPQNMTETSAKDLIVSADRFVLLGLKKVAEKFLVSKLTVQNASDLLIFADTYSAETLKTSATDFVAKNLKQVVKIGGWDVLNRRHQHLTKELVLKALESDSDSPSDDSSDDD